MTEPVTAAPPGPAAIPPAPLYFADLCAFRESFLQLVPAPVGGRLLRELGEKIAEVTLDLSFHWREAVDSSVAGDVHAALGDLRQLRGLVARIGGAWKEGSLEAADIVLSQAVAAEVQALAEVAGRLEGLLARHRAEAEAAAAEWEGRE
jgi:hypothetical protein